MISTKEPFSYFYLLAKVHKDPWRTRPVISSCGSMLFCVSKWIDRELQKIIKHLDYTTTSSLDLIHELKNITISNKTVKVFTMDASAFYTNIEKNHAYKVIKDFFEERTDIMEAEKINTSLLLNTLAFVMRYNIFKFGNAYFKQITGCAMGTPCAPPYATLYFFSTKEKSYQSTKTFYNSIADLI